jgi:hypothetical protein
MIDLIDHSRATGISSCKLWQLFFEHHLQIFKKCQDIILVKGKNFQNNRKD